MAYTRKKFERYEVRGVLTIPFKVTVSSVSNKQAEMEAWDHFLRVGITPHVKGKYKEFKVKSIKCKTCHKQSQKQEDKD